MYVTHMYQTQTPRGTRQLGRRITDRDMTYYRHVSVISVFVRLLRHISVFVRLLRVHFGCSASWMRTLRHTSGVCIQGTTAVRVVSICHTLLACAYVIAICHLHVACAYFVGGICHMAYAFMFHITRSLCVECILIYMCVGVVWIWCWAIYLVCM